MKFTIDTENKTVTLEENLSLSEIDELKKYLGDNWQEWRLVVTKGDGPWAPYPYYPSYEPVKMPWQSPVIYPTSPTGDFPFESPITCATFGVIS